MYFDNMGIPFFFNYSNIEYNFLKHEPYPMEVLILLTHPATAPPWESLSLISEAKCGWHATEFHGPGGIFLFFSFWDLFMGSSWWEICLLPGHALRDGVELPLAQLQTQNGRELLILPDPEPCHLPAWARSCSLLGLLYPGLTSLLWHLPHCVVTYKFVFLSLGADGELLESKGKSHFFSFP